MSFDEYLSWNSVLKICVIFFMGALCYGIGRNL